MDYRILKRDQISVKRKEAALKIPSDPVKEISLTKNEANVDRLEPLFQKFAQLEVAEKVHLTRVSFSDKHAELLVRFIQNGGPLREIVLEQCRLRTSHIKLICDAIGSNQNISALSLLEVNVLSAGGTSIADMLRSNKELKSLTLYGAGIGDLSIKAIAQGIQESHHLEYLDVRQNIFEAEGFKELMAAIRSTMSLKHLHFMGVKFEVAQAVQLASFLSHPNCQIVDLTLSQIELCHATQTIIFDALKAVQSLESVSFARNSLKDSLWSCSSIVELCRTHKRLMKLCVSHAELGYKGFQVLSKGLQSCFTLKYLNLAWNNLPPASMVDLVDLLNFNQHLEKLLIQHNDLGSDSMQDLAHVLEHHIGIKYLDVSANKILAKGLKPLLRLLCCDEQLHTFQCRKNEIVGEHVDGYFKQLIGTTRAKILNFSDNHLITKNADELCEVAKREYHIEQLDLEGNKGVSHSVIEEISKHCRHNLLIQQYILPTLPLAQDTGFTPSASYIANAYKYYDPRVLSFQDQHFCSSDFIVKFIDVNKADFQSLIMKNCKTSRQFHSLAEWLKREGGRDLKIKEFVFENSQISKDYLSDVIRVLGHIRSLQRVHLTQIEGVSSHLHAVCNGFKHLAGLKELNLQSNGIADCQELVQLIKANTQIRKLDLRGNPLSDDNIDELHRALSDNFHLLELLVDEPAQNSSQQSGQSRRTTFDQYQLELNKEINQIIIQQKKTQRVPSRRQQNQVKLRELSLWGVKFDRIESVMKLVRLQRIKSLDLRATGVTREMIAYIVSTMIDSTDIQLEVLDLSMNSIGAEEADILGRLIAFQTPLKTLKLSDTALDVTGLEQILSQTMKSVQFMELEVRNCEIHIQSGDDCNRIVAMLHNNCSIVKIDLYGNHIEDEENFYKAVDKELSLNKLIVEHIFPSVHLHRESQSATATRQKPIAGLAQISSLKKAISKEEIPATRSLDNELGALVKLKSAAETIAGTKPLSARGKRKVSFFFEQEEKQTITGKGLQTQPIEEEIKSDVGLDLPKAKSDDERSQSSASQFGKSAGGFKIDLEGKHLTSLEFLSKFIRIFPDINKIDFGRQKLLSDQQMAKFARGLQSNINIQEIEMEGMQLSKATRSQLLQQITCNRQIFQHLGVEDDLLARDGKSSMGTNKDSQVLELGGKGIRDTQFLAKLFRQQQGVSHVQKLDLSNNDLGNQGCKQVAEMLQNNFHIKYLDLRHNKIGTKGLQYICSVLATQNSTIQTIDISDNIITDQELKIFLALLYQNQSIVDIQYSLSLESNIEKLAKYRQLEAKGASVEVMRQDLLHIHEPQIKKWHKLFLVVWFWKSMMHAKHEAFRFKYDTHSLAHLEQNVMHKLGILLYINAFVYYVIMFACPFIFVSSECGGGLHFTSHLIYGLYSVVNAIFEVTTVFYIQRQIQNKEILSFNKWHWVELIMGQIARFDTYLDVCFLSLLLQCQQWNLIIPVTIFIVLFLIYPLTQLFLLMKPQRDLSHTQPLMERNAKLCFIRENMLLATVLDSFCINNFVWVCKKPLVFARVMAILTFLLQDFPQMTIHIYFLIYEHDGVPHADTTVTMSLVASSMAICISFFNIWMCTPNEFDPILLQIELKARVMKKLQLMAEKTTSKLTNRRHMFALKRDEFKKKISQADQGQQQPRKGESKDPTQNMNIDVGILKNKGARPQKSDQRKRTIPKELLHLSGIQEVDDSRKQSVSLVSEVSSQQHSGHLKSNASADSRMNKLTASPSRGDDCEVETISATSQQMVRRAPGVQQLKTRHRMSFNGSEQSETLGLPSSLIDLKVDIKKIRPGNTLPSHRSQ